jgi:hypothetical protein
MSNTEWLEAALAPILQKSTQMAALTQGLQSTTPEASGKDTGDHGDIYMSGQDLMDLQIPEQFSMEALTPMSVSQTQPKANQTLTGMGGTLADSMWNDPSHYNNVPGASSVPAKPLHTQNPSPGKAARTSKPWRPSGPYTAPRGPRAAPTPRAGLNTPPRGPHAGLDPWPVPHSSPLGTRAGSTLGARAHTPPRGLAQPAVSKPFIQNPGAPSFVPASSVQPAAPAQPKQSPNKPAPGPVREPGKQYLKDSIWAPKRKFIEFFSARSHADQFPAS